MTDSGSRVAPRPGGVAARSRMAWLDVAKGCCILLVVLHHTVAKYVPLILPEDLHAVAEGWQFVSLFLKPLRMPVFFVISGFLAAGAINRPWRVSLRRVTGPYYLYLVWLAGYTLFYRLETRVEANRVENLPDLIGDLFWAETSMWFLYALAVYFVIAKCLRGVSPWLVIGAAGLVALWTGWSGIEYNNKVSVLAHFGFFALGAYFPDLVRRSATVSSRRLWSLAGAYLVLFLSLQSSGLPWSVTLVACSAVGIPLGLGVAHRLAAREAAAVPLGWLGRRTLRIYVLHFAVIGVLVHLPYRLTGTGPGSWLLAMAAPVGITAAVTVACLGLHAFARYYGGALLFRLPAPVERWQARWAAGAAPGSTSGQPAWATGQPGTTAAGTTLSAGKVPRSASR